METGPRGPSTVEELGMNGHKTSLVLPRRVLYCTLHIGTGRTVPVPLATQLGHTCSILTTIATAAQTFGSPGGIDHVKAPHGSRRSA